MQRTRRAGDFASGFSWAMLALLSVLILALTGFTTWRNWQGGALHPSAVSHSMPEEDFANLWAAGRMVRGGQLAALYTADGFQRWKETQFGRPLQGEAWVYPPTVLLLGVPLSYLPLGWGFLAWDAASVAASVFLLRYARLPWGVVAFGLGGPAAWRSLVLGQYGLVTGALVAAGLVLAPRFPVRAGLMLGLATLKPQQGAIIPVAWLAARNWRAIGAAALVFAVLAAAIAVAFGGAAFGGAAWTMFFSRTGGLARRLLEARPPQNYISDGVSVFWMLRTAGASIGVAYAAQLVVAVGAAGAVYRAWGMADVEPLARVAATLSLALLITPYGFTSDMVGVSIAWALLVAGKRWRLNVLDAAIWLWPAYCPLVTLKTGILMTPCVVAIVAAQAWRRMRTPWPPGPIVGPTLTNP